MTKLISPERPAWFYMFFALGLFVTLNTYIGAKGHGNAQIPLLLYLIILGSIIAKYHSFRWRSPSIIIFSLLILYGAVGSFVARASGQDTSYFTGMALGIIVVSLHFLPKGANIDFRLIKSVLYYSGLLFVVSRIGSLLAAQYIDTNIPALFLTHEVAFLLPFIVLIPLFEKKWIPTFAGLALCAMFLVLDFRTTTFLIYLVIAFSAIVFMMHPVRILLKNLPRILLLLFPLLVVAVAFLSDNVVNNVMDIDRHFRDLLGRSDTQTFRQNLNELALENIAKNPLFGEVFQGNSISIQHLYFGLWRTDPVHNVFLTMGSQGGLVFLIPFLVLLSLLMISGVRVATQFWETQPEGAKVLVTLVVGLMSAMLSGAVNPFLSYAMGAFWFWTIVMLIYLVRDTLLARAKNAAIERVSPKLHVQWHERKNPCPQYRQR